MGLCPAPHQSSESSSPGPGLVHRHWKPWPWPCCLRGDGQRVRPVPRTTARPRGVPAEGDVRTSVSSPVTKDSSRCPRSGRCSDDPASSLRRRLLVAPITKRRRGRPTPRCRERFRHRKLLRGAFDWEKPGADQQTPGTEQSSLILRTNARRRGREPTQMLAWRIPPHPKISEFFVGSCRTLFSDHYYSRLRAMPIALTLVRTFSRRTQPEGLRYRDFFKAGADKPIENDKIAHSSFRSFFPALVRHVDDAVAPAVTAPGE